MSTLHSGAIALLLIGAGGCGSSTEAESDSPRIVSGVPDPCELLPPDVWESIVDASVAESSVGDTKENVVRASCFYRYEDGGIGRLTIEDAAAWERRREEERKDFEDRGVLLPDDQPVSGFGDEAILDVRHNELNVRSGDFVMRADHGRPVASGAEALSPAEKEDSRDLQREIIGEALNRLEQSGPG